MKYTKEDLLNLLELRTNLEHYCYERCINSATTEEVNKLYEFIEKFQKLNRKEKIKKHNQADINFHNMLGDIAKIPRLPKYINEIQILMLAARANLKNSPRVNEIIDSSWEMHYSIVKAIELKNSESVKALVDEHMNLVKETQIFSLDS